MDGYGSDLGEDRPLQRHRWPVSGKKIRGADQIRETNLYGQAPRVAASDVAQTILIRDNYSTRSSARLLAGHAEPKPPTTKQVH